MAKPTIPRRRCTHCKGWVEARMIQSARMEWGDLSTTVFAKSMPVLICSKCDTAPPKDATFPPAARR